MSAVTETFRVPAAGVERVRCLECAARACDAIGLVPGVVSAHCDEARASVVVTFDSSRVSEAEIELALERFGLAEARRVAHAAWRVTGLD